MAKEMQMHIHYLERTLKARSPSSLAMKEQESSNPSAKG